ncbi:hypothetical protein FGB62_55g167 [Gracilaria domingensis]|nr:hypothetical protein FGB62_55g167 [Gracilaria domingensis]
MPRSPHSTSLMIPVPMPAMSAAMASNRPSRQRSGHHPLARLRPLPLLRAARSALAALKLLPIFTPRQTLARWRSQRALRNAAREARRSVGTRKTLHEFRLNGLTWHQLYIVQDLRRIHQFLRHVENRLREGDARALRAVVPLERSFAYLVDNVWAVYNVLERDVLFPWVRAGTAEPVVTKALHLFSKERQRIEHASDVAHERLARLVCATGYAYTSAGLCSSKSTFRAIRNKSARRRRKKKTTNTEHVKGELDGKQRSEKAELNIREGYEPEDGLTLTSSQRAINAEEVRQVAVEISKLIHDCESLRKTKSSVLYPLIADRFSEREQMRLTYTLVYSMRSTLAKFMISVYHQAVEKQASRIQWSYYKREVPLPIRVYTPVWRARLYDDCPLGWLRCTKPRDIDG